MTYCRQHHYPANQPHLQSAGSTSSIRGPRMASPASSMEDCAGVRCLEVETGDASRTNCVVIAQQTRILLFGKTSENNHKQCGRGRITEIIA